MTCLYESCLLLSYCACFQSSQYDKFFTLLEHYTRGTIVPDYRSMTSFPFLSSPPCPCLYFCPSSPLLPPPPHSVHPSTHLAEVRSGRPRRVEWSEGWSDSWSPVRQGETNYPSNESHSSSLHLSLLSSLSSSTPLLENAAHLDGNTGEKKKKNPPNFTLDAALI